MTSGSPSAPWRWAPWPWPPRSARKWARRRKLCRSRRLSSQRSSTSPPRPPSPPSGPPLGTCASRRNDRQPLPPAPARTSIRARSESIQTIVAEGERRGTSALAWQAKPISEKASGEERARSPGRRNRSPRRRAARNERARLAGETDLPEGERRGTSTLAWQAKPISPKASGEERARSPGRRNRSPRRRAARNEHARLAGETDLPEGERRGTSALAWQAKPISPKASGEERARSPGRRNRSPLAGEAAVYGVTGAGVTVGTGV